jgi:hypothetical protein
VIVWSAVVDGLGPRAIARRLNAAHLLRPAEHGLWQQGGGPKPAPTEPWDSGDVRRIKGTMYYRYAVRALTVVLTDPGADPEDITVKAATAGPSGILLVLLSGDGHFRS